MDGIEKQPCWCWETNSCRLYHGILCFYISSFSEFHVLPFQYPWSIIRRLIWFHLLLATIIYKLVLLSYREIIYFNFHIGCSNEFNLLRVCSRLCECIISFLTKVVHLAMLNVPYLSFSPLFSRIFCHLQRDLSDWLIDILIFAIIFIPNLTLVCFISLRG